MLCVLSCHNSLTYAKHALRVANNYLQMQAHVQTQTWIPTDTGEVWVCFTNNVKTIPWSGTDKFGVQLVEACLPYSHSHPKRRPQSPQMAIPGSFQQPAPALLCPWGPLPNHPPALSPREVQTAAAWDHPCTSSHTLELFPSHLYSDGQANLLLSTLATRLATRGRHVGRCSFFMVPELPHKDQLCEVSTFIVLFSFKGLPDWAILYILYVLKLSSELALENKNNFLHLITACSCLIVSSHPEDV